MHESRAHQDVQTIMADETRAQFYFEDSLFNRQSDINIMI